MSGAATPRAANLSDRFNTASDGRLSERASLITASTCRATFAGSTAESRADGSTALLCAVAIAELARNTSAMMLLLTVVVERILIA